MSNAFWVVNAIAAVVAGRMAILADAVCLAIRDRREQFRSKVKAGTGRETEEAEVAVCGGGVTGPVPDLGF